MCKFSRQDAHSLILPTQVDYLGGGDYKILCSVEMSTEPEFISSPQKSARFKLRRDIFRNCEL